MSRSGYSDDYDDEHGALAMWRGRISSATRGKRGQKFFRDLVAALDAMPEKRLIANNLEDDDTGAVCALGCLAKAKGAALDPDDTTDYDKLGVTFNIAPCLSQEVMFMNDEAGPRADTYTTAGFRRGGETPEQRWTRMRRWAVEQLRPTPEPDSEAPRG